MVSPLNGARSPTGAHPGNTGGKAGRSGRKPDEFKEELAAIRDAEGLGVLQEILNGEVTYTLRGVCSHCGKTSEGLATFGDLLKLTPSVDSRLRAVDMTMRYTVGLEKTIRLEGIQGVQQAFDVIKQRIRAALPAETATALLEDIKTQLRAL